MDDFYSSEDWEWKSEEMEDQDLPCQDSELSWSLLEFQLEREWPLEEHIRLQALKECQQRLSKAYDGIRASLPPAMPRPVIEGIVKWVLIGGDIKTINNVRRISHEFRAVIEEPRHLRILQTSNEIRRLERAKKDYQFNFSNETEIQATVDAYRRVPFNTGIIQFGNIEASLRSQTYETLIKSRTPLIECFIYFQHHMDRCMDILKQEKMRLIQAL
jgi:hypothetical protein